LIQYYQSILKNLFLKIITRFLAIPRIIVSRYFNLNKFHESSFLQKPYCGIIVNYLNNRKIRNKALEIGCGTGDILLNLNFKNIYGFDKYDKALKVMKFTNDIRIFRKKNLLTKNYDFNDDNINIDGTYDVLILCNFTFKFRKEFLKNKIESLYHKNLNKGGELIIDIIKINPKYLYRKNETSYEKKNNFKNLHNINFLNSKLKGEITFLGEHYLYPFKKPSFSKYKRMVYSIRKK